MTTTFAAPRAEVRISGVSLSAEVSRRVLSVRYDNNLDVADMFTVVLDNADDRFTDSPLFALGNTVEVHLGYGEALQPMMLGEITAIAPDYPSSGAPTLSVSGYDRSYRLRHDVPDRPPYRAMTDSAIAAQIAVEAGLIPEVDPSIFGPHDELVQTETDMALLQKRARANHFEVYVWWDRLFFRFPRPQTEAHVLEWGRNLSRFAPRLSSAGQAAVQVVRGYNEELAQTVVGIMAAPALDLDTIVERLGSSAVDLLAGMGRRVIRDQPIKSPLDARSLAKAILQEILEGMYEASGSCAGIPELRAGRAVEVRGIGKRFTGTYRLTRVTHTLDTGGYRTEFESNQRAGSVLLGLLRRSVIDRPSSSGEEPIGGVVIGVVAAVDPEGYQVAVRLPWLSDKGVTVTAKCATFMAGPGRGAFFLPDPGDQVLVAFERGSLASPFVIGSLWDNVGGTPAPDADRTNAVRRLRTRSGHTVTFDDTSGAEQIVVTGASGSTVVLHGDGTVSITAKKDLELHAPDGEIRLDAGDVRVKVAGTMDVSQA